MLDFLKELTRRKVWLFGGIYLALGWVLLQVAALLESTLELPDWIDQSALVLLIIGFPVALLLAWAQESQVGDEAKTAPAAAQTTTSTRTPDTGMQPSGEGRSILSIAVLPFADMSPDKDQDWFSDGISEEIIHRLVQEKQLTVAGRTSSFYFKGKNVPFEEIGEMLKVGTVLEGSVRRFEDRIRITGQLIDVETGAHKWSGTYDRDLKDVFKVQDEIAATIARELLRQMDLVPSGTVQVQYEPNMEAYQAYLQAKQIWMQPTPENTREAARLYHKAADLDPGFLAPLIDLAVLLAYNQGAVSQFIEVGTYDMKALVAEAIKRNPSEAELHILKAQECIADWEFSEADDHLRQRHVVVGTAESGWGLGVFLSLTLRPREALPHLKEALRVSPFDHMPRIWIMRCYGMMGEFDKTEGLLDEIDRLGMPPSAVFISLHASYAYRRGDMEAYLKYRKQLEDMVEEGDRNLAVLDFYIAVRDRNIGVLEAGLKGLEAMYEEAGDVSSIVHMANIAAALGDFEKCHDYYERAVNTHAPAFTFSLGSQDSPGNLYLVSDPKGRKLLERAGFKLAWIDGDKELSGA